MKVYYAHSMHLYNTKQEQRDIHLLEQLGFEVVNPSCKEISDGCATYKEKYGGANVMKYFDSIIDGCDALAYRGHIDGRIPSGVGYEIKYAMDKNKPLFELPTLYNSKFMEVGETKQYLELLGNR